MNSFSLNYNSVNVIMFSSLMLQMGNGDEAECIPYDKILSPMPRFHMLRQYTVIGFDFISEIQTLELIYQTYVT